MSYNTIEVNSPAPYFCLNKLDKQPEVLVITGAKKNVQAKIEKDIKILTSHNCDSAICLAYYSNGKTFLRLPTEAVTDSMLTRGGFIKLDCPTSEQVIILDKKVTECKDSKEPAIIMTSNTFDPVFFEQLKLTSNTTLKIELLVVDLPVCLKYLNVSPGSLSSVEKLFQLLQNSLSDKTIVNILVLNTNFGTHGNVLYLGETSELFNLQSNTPITVDPSSVTTSVIANLSQGYELKESVYGAIEFIQNANLLESSTGTPNYMYNIEVPLKHMLKDECFKAHEMQTANFVNHTSPVGEGFFEYLINHSLVKPHWESYVNHDFVRQIANGTLDINKFRFFIEQDYSYLVDYGRVHCIAGSKSPELDNMEEELVIVGRIREEMAQHEKRLKEFFGVTDNSYFKNIKRGPALNNYSRYFNDVAKRGSWEELVAALTPCMMGYGVAALKYKGKITAKKGSLYEEWIDIYSCSNYEDGMKIGQNLLNRIARTSTPAQIERLARIYGEVCALETEFWDAALAY
ncbi:similar to Saccharomyces cerevisiae YOL055C THI20 Multifunctional protein with hydroxymethylpyrimidine phosphate (HMP-P) kinase and thiaminase activities [Maudiozyma saulgeensis]|uniref:Similar to Saccharomyces cerevisiae YOL055C THI20 Multifunctional protein with hydroxymethylpyrimidine phosphate (HMP-P) kinase and thiaminase activities n=1 Tax=Maudiozyma saulgeensis TaxID=1789683 RepID=A0A1X7R332_9SACH|nr:similar to Saccharomyces cerevisiae YOL055C THI20 Multifunctional protein with hydroxymethylpyrimidine phosphate (HMP-P) kinase and thiaminase activities [Kazachstania saulgeensis]